MNGYKGARDREKIVFGCCEQRLQSVRVLTGVIEPEITLDRCSNVEAIL